MNNSNFIKSFVLTILISIIGLFAHANIEHFANSTSGSGIAVGTNVLVIDQNFSQMYTPNWSSNFKNLEVNNRVQLRIDRYIPSNVTGSFTVSVGLSIIGTDASGASSTQNTTLQVLYDPDAGKQETDIDLHVLNGFHMVDVQITSITSTAAGGIVPNNIVLENLMEIDRLYNFSNTIAPTISATIISSNKHVQFTWNNPGNAEEFDLEWVLVEDYNTSGFLNPIDLNYDFKARSVRVRVKTSSYTIPNVFQHGYLLYRVRGVSRNWSNENHIQLGEWSNNNWQGVVSSFNERIAIGSHESDEKNWSFSAAYAEYGARSEAVAYADGTGRTRQSVGYDKDKNSAIVSELIYDFHGRAAIQIMPVPSNEDKLEYYENFNQDASGGNLDWQDFDVDVVPNDPCAPKDLVLGENSGAAKYYSSNNTDQEFQQAYLPDANGYAYRRVEYTPDMSGKTKRVSAVGSTHKLGSGRESKITYDNADMKLLERYFHPDDVGSADKYSQVYVTDGNGQMNTRIYDDLGNVVLSGLIGSAPSNVSAISGSNGTNTRDLLNNREMRSFTDHNEGIRQLLPYPRTDALTTIDNLVAVSGGNHSITYTITPAQFTSACLPSGFCYDCSYKVYISLIDVDCNQPMFTPIQQDVNFSLDQTCNSAQVTITPPAVSLVEGKKYALVKQLVIDASAVEEITQDVMENSTCISSYNDFYKEIYDFIDFSACYATYCDYECYQEIGSLDEFLAANPTLNASDWQSQMDACKEKCNDVDPCEALQNSMLFDLRPGGQYGLFLDATMQLNPSSHPISIYNENNSLPSGNDWRDASGFVDEKGNTDLILNSLGTLVAPNHSSISLTEFVKHWKPSWAQAFVTYHPEYCYYTYCTSQSASHNYSTSLWKTDDFTTASTMGYFNPLNMTILEGAPTGFYPSSNPDPFFQSGGGGASKLAAFKLKMNNYITLGATSYSMWDMAVILVNCPDEDTEAGWNTCLQNYSLIGGCQNNRMWQTFRSIYLREKEMYYDELVTEYAIENKCYNGCIGVSSGNFDETEHNFDCYDLSALPACLTNSSFYDGYQDSDQPCSINNLSLFENKAQRYTRHDNQYVSGLPIAQWQTNTTNTQNLLTGTYCHDNCTAMADDWIDALGPCAGMNASVEAAIKAELIELCKLGCTDQPYGSRTAPNGNTTANGNASFHEVLEYHLGSNYPTSSCNALFITEPDPFGYVPFMASGELDDCACKNILESSYEFINNTPSGLPSWVTNNEEYYEYLYGNMPDYSEKKCACEDAFEKFDGSPWNTGATWSQDMMDYLFDQGIEIPSGHGCMQNCIGCTELEALKNDLQNDYNITTSHPKYFVLLARLGNWTYNFKMSALDYELLDQKCEGTCTPTLTPKAKELEKLLDELAANGQFITNTPATLDLNTVSNYNWWQNTAIYKDLTGANNLYVCTNAPLNSNVNTAVCNNNTKQLFFGTNDEYCTVTLIIPTNYVNDGYSFEDLALLENMKPGQITCASTKNFTIEATIVHPLYGFKVIEIDGNISCFNIAENCCDNPMLCNGPIVIEDNNNGCRDRLVLRAKEIALENYKKYWDEKYWETYEMVFEQCLNGVSESLQLEAPFEYSEYTVYYYDQSNNLVQTVPPRGSIDDETGNHTLTTQYRHNSMNQVTEQSSPDGGHSKFYYDKAHRLVLSENAKQRNNNAYSYTLFDEIGRAYEVGELSNSAYSFNGSNSSISIPAGNLVGHDNFTYSAWVRINQLPGTNQYYCILHVGGLGGDQHVMLGNHPGNQHIGFGAGSYSTTAVTNAFTNTTPAVNTWYHVVFTRTNTTGIIYINGLPITTFAVTGPANYGNPIQANIGSRRGNLQLFNGDIDNVSFYNCEMTAQEVKALYKSGSSNSCGGPLAHYGLNGDAKDLSGNGNHGTIVNATPTASLTPILNTGDFQEIVDDPVKLKSWVESASRSQVTRTYYDKAFNNNAVQSRFDGGQQYLRNRVSMTAYYPTYGNGIGDGDYEHATYYSYDPHGNVVQNVEDAQFLEEIDMNLTETSYEFEVLSKQINEINYQKGKADGISHKYHYDANSRLKHVYTSSNDHIWDRDAKYFYYDHGQLARVEIGEHKVNGTDYAYTLNGWIKGVNSNTLNAHTDQGHDGYLLAATNTNRVNEQVAHDAFAYSLGYFNADYSPISNLESGDQFLADQTGSGLLSGTTEMFNGNISQMITSIDGFNTQASVFGYDQLNRLLAVDVYENLEANNNSWSSGGLLDDYKTRIAYDSDGNITSLLRNGFGANLDMDDMTYHYTAGNNQLDKVIDAAISTYTVDIAQGQQNSNYTYDEIGNLISDVSENITNIEWNVYGKVQSMTIDGQDFHFYYNALGQRVGKEVVDKHNVDESNWTVYRRGAGGTVMGTYKFFDYLTESHKEATLHLDEQYLYGSSRLGVHKRDKLLRQFLKTDPNQPAEEDETITTIENQREIGYKHYEQSNHLGNVLTTITDRKLVTNTKQLVHSDQFSSLNGWQPNNPPHDQLSINSNNEMELITKYSWNGCSKEYTVESGYSYTVTTEVQNVNAGVGVFYIQEPGSSPGSWVTTYAHPINGSNMHSFSFNVAVNSSTIRAWYTITNASPSNICTVRVASLTLEALQVPTFVADFSSKTDYYAYGMVKPGRSWNSDAYRHGFNGMEKDDELKGGANHYSTHFRQYDPRLGRWFSKDPIVHPFLSTYNAFDGNPIYLSDPRGSNSEKPGDPKKTDKQCRCSMVDSEGNRYTEAGSGYESPSDVMVVSRMGYSFGEVSGSRINTHSSDNTRLSKSNLTNSGGAPLSVKSSSSFAAFLSYLRYLDFAQGGDHYTSKDAVGAENGTKVGSENVRHTDITELIAVLEKYVPSDKVVDAFNSASEYGETLKKFYEKDPDDITVKDLFDVLSPLKIELDLKDKNGTKIFKTKSIMDIIEEKAPALYDQLENDNSILNQVMSQTKVNSIPDKISENETIEISITWQSESDGSMTRLRRLVKMVNGERKVERDTTNYK